MRRWKLWRNLLILLVVIFPLLVATTIYKDRVHQERIEQRKEFSRKHKNARVKIRREPVVGEPIVGWMGEYYPDWAYDEVMEYLVVDTEQKLREAIDLYDLDVVEHMVVTDVGDKGAVMSLDGLKLIAQSVGVQNLELRNFTLTQQAIPILAEIETLTRLRIDQAGEDVTDLVALEDLPDLETFIFPIGLNQELVWKLVCHRGKITKTKCLEPAYHNLVLTDDLLVHLAEERSWPYLPIVQKIDCSNEGLRHLANCPELRSLDLRGCDIDDAGVQSIARLQKLKSLDLSDTKFQDSRGELLQPFFRLSSLNLANCAVGDQVLPAIQQMSLLEELNLAGTNVVRIEQLPLFSGIKTLDLSRTAVTAENLRNLHQYKKLRSLGVGGCRELLLANVEHLPDFPVLQFSLAGSVLNLSTMNAVTRIPGITSLDLTACKGLSGELIEVLGDLPITFITLDATNPAPEVLASVARLPELRGVKLRRNELSAERLRQVGEMGHLHHIDLSKSQLSSDGMEYLENLSHVRFLNFSSTNLTDDMLWKMTGIPEVQSPEELKPQVPVEMRDGKRVFVWPNITRSMNLSNTQVTPASSPLFKNYFLKLRELDLRGTPFTPNEIKRIKRSLQLCNIKIDANSPPIRDEQ